MSENTPTPPATRKPANQVLMDFLKEKDITFLVRRQEVRFLEDNGMVIEPPKIIVFYQDEIPKNNKVDLPEVKK
jgi:hypothetical protein